MKIMPCTYLKVKWQKKDKSFCLCSIVNFMCWFILQRENIAWGRVHKLREDNRLFSWKLLFDWMAMLKKEYVAGNARILRRVQLQYRFLPTFIWLLPFHSTQYTYLYCLGYWSESTAESFFVLLARLPIDVFT